MRCEIPVGAPRGSHRRAAGSLRKHPHFSQPCFPFLLSCLGDELLGFLGDVLHIATGISGQTHGQPVNPGPSSLPSLADGEVSTALANPSDPGTVISDKGGNSLWDPFSWQLKDLAAGGQGCWRSSPRFLPQAGPGWGLYQMALYCHERHSLLLWDSNFKSRRYYSPLFFFIPALFVGRAESLVLSERTTATLEAGVCSLGLCLQLCAWRLTGPCCHCWQPW